MGFEPANFFLTSGANPTYPTTDTAAGAGSGIGAAPDFSYPTTPGNPNSSTTTANNSATGYAEALHVERPVIVYRIQHVSGAAGNLTLADHGGNQATVWALAVGGHVDFGPNGIVINKGLRATMSAGVAAVFYKDLGPKPRKVG